jgi:hypothetical protein
MITNYLNWWNETALKELAPKRYCSGYSNDASDISLRNRAKSARLTHVFHFTNNHRRYTTAVLEDFLPDTGR